MSKSQRLKSVERLENSAPLSTINHQDIAERAYALYLGRGGEDGHDVEDWLAAELGLREERLYYQKQKARKASAS
jgi:hypothetical protein